MATFAPSPAPAAVTCSAALKQAAASNVHLLHALLPIELIALVDRLITSNAWRWTGQLTKLDLPPLDAGDERIDHMCTTLRDGEEVLVRIVT